MSVPVEYLIFKVKILKRSFFIIAIVSVAAFLFRQSGFAFGFLVGGVMSVFIFQLLYKYVLALREISAGQRKKFLIPRALLIYLIMGVVLFIAIKKGMPVFIGAAAGLFSLKLVIFAEAFRGRSCQQASS
ncbi:MAG: hypothetical protein HQ558_07020 [Candidatus Omnitrophica bacterium]|nr:hypothetical protein [Candidatus Omnitrophota bacterium]